MLRLESARRVVRRLRKRFRQSRLNVSLTLERLIERPMTGGSPREGHVLVVAPGGGSVGDEAMYRAFIQNAEGRVVVVTRTPRDLLAPVQRPGVSEVALPGLFYGGFFARRRDLARFLAIASTARTVSLIGADVMDGAYSEAASVRRFRTVELAAKAGAESRVLGFSWNAHPGKEAVRAMREARHVTLLARDSVSFDRLRRDGATLLELVSDLAFLTRGEGQIADTRLDHWLGEQAALGRPVALINANPGLAKAFPGQLSAYASAIETLVADGFSCVIVPHDSRSGQAGEIHYQQRLEQMLAPSPRVLRLGSILDPAQVCALAARCDFALSGRMHLIILSSVSGTVAIGLEYQDKFEGLYAHLGYAGRLQPPEGDEATDFLPYLREFLDRRAASRTALDRRMPELLALARLNVPD